MKLHTLGTGGPRPDPARTSACHVLEVGAERLMFDIGRGAIQHVAQKGFPMAGIGPLFVTHLHVDHIGELANYLITSWLAGRRKPLQVFGPPGIAGIVDVLIKSVYELDIAFRTQGETAFGPFIGAEVTEVRAGAVFDAGTYKVSCAEMEHGHGLPFGPLFRQRWICLAYRVEAEGKVFTFSGDAVMCDPLVEIAKGSDLHLQCCYMATSEMQGGHFKGVGQYTLACSDTAGKIAARAGVKRLVLTHFRETTPVLMEEMRSDIARDYTGPFDFAEDLGEFSV